MLKHQFDGFIDALHGAHAGADPLICAVLTQRFDTLAATCRRLPDDLGLLAEQLLWDLLPADWALWQELDREECAVPRH